MKNSTSVTRIPFGDIEKINKNLLFEKLSSNGVIIFEKGATNILDFACYVREHSSKLSLDPARTIEGGAAQLVDAGTDAVGLHCENGNSPFWPDLCWFYCQEAPPVASHTTICDGVVVFNHLSNSTKEFFQINDICYSRNVEPDKWKKLVCHYTPEIDNISQAKFEHLKKY
ncbi:TauD/TfdA family dioxygenase [Vibrio sp.]|uniref:TauD/TfdA family dioxygenase n=1 Tax=Vibrio sp. TaxID=678 RepID=UPI00311D47F7